MSNTVLYLFQPSSNTELTLTRREIFWLVKDRLIETDQNGWSFSHGQVEPYPPNLDDGVIGQLPLDTTQLRESVGRFFEDRTGFIVPLQEEFDAASVVRRLATVDKLGVIDDLNTAQVQRIGDSGSFWRASTTESALGTSSSERRAAFNIAHPYMTGPLFDGIAGQEFSLTPGGIRSTAGEEGPLYSLLFTSELFELEERVDRVRKLASRVPTGTYLAVSNHCKGEARFAMDEQEIDTNALSAGSVFVEIQEAVNADSTEVGRFIEKLDELGLSLAGEIQSDSVTYLVFKFHPRHGDLETAGPSFVGSRERRKLMHTKWAREHLPGYKGLQSGEREVAVASFDDWVITAQRPGRKDADDFTYHINGPGLSEVKETKPHLHRIFNDVARHLYCPESGTVFLETLYRIWDAQVPMEECAEFVEEAHGKMPACSQAEALYYDRRVLLYSLALQFIVEDINYRFNFHPTYGGPSYRKQGRDQPMNGLLQVGANQFTESEIEALAESTKSGGLLERPNSFEGPTHLEGWYQQMGITQTGSK